MLQALKKVSGPAAPKLYIHQHSADYSLNPTIKLIVDSQAKLRYSPSTIKDLIFGSEAFILGEKEIDYIDGSRASVDARAMGEAGGDGRRRG